MREKRGAGIENGMQGRGNGGKIITAAKGINAAVGLNSNARKVEWIMTKAEIIEKVKEVIAAPSCCPEAKAACQAYLDAVGTEGEKAAEKAMIAELKEDVTSIEGFIAFSASDTGKKIFGEAQAKAMNEAAVKAQAAGAKYCICAACTAGGAILDELA